MGLTLMSKRMAGRKLDLTAGCLTAALFFAGVVLAADPEPSGFDEESISRIIPDVTVVEPELIESNGFTIKTYRAKEVVLSQSARGFHHDGSEYQALWAASEDTFSVGMERQRAGALGGGIGVFHRESMTPMLTASDRDGDGRIDFIEYWVLDETGEEVTAVMDYEADGQADVRLHRGESSYELWFEDRWYRTEMREGVRGIVVQDRFREIKNIDNRPVVQ
jgi:hypothetical protein